MLAQVVMKKKNIAHRKQRLLGAAAEQWLSLAQLLFSIRINELLKIPVGFQKTLETDKIYNHYILCVFGSWLLHRGNNIFFNLLEKFWPESMKCFHKNKSNKAQVWLQNTSKSQRKNMSKLRYYIADSKTDEQYSNFLQKWKTFLSALT